MPQTTITITDEHKQWIEENAINLSKWVRKQLEEAMEEHEYSRHR